MSQAKKKDRLRRLALVPEPDRASAIERLYEAVSRCRNGGQLNPRTSKLIAAGRKKMAQKLVEEAAEAALETVHGERQAVVHESADLLYQLVVLWNELGIKPAEVFREMARRETLYGIAEKLAKPGPAGGGAAGEEE